MAKTVLEKRGHRMVVVIQGLVVCKYPFMKGTIYSADATGRNDVIVHCNSNGGWM
jgi:hypothetical protein